MNYFTDIDRLKDELKKKNVKVALTTGCFDVLHKAHLDYLKDAKSRGDVLVVLLQSDELTNQRKGTKDITRPVYFVEERARQLLSSEGYEGVIDYILIVDSVEDIYNSIKEIHPDVLVLSEATESDETDPKRLREYFRNEMKVDILAPKTAVHSRDIIRERERGDNPFVSGKLR